MKYMLFVFILAVSYSKLCLATDDCHDACPAGSYCKKGVCILPLLVHKPKPVPATLPPETEPPITEPPETEPPETEPPETEPPETEPPETEPPETEPPITEPPETRTAVPEIAFTFLAEETETTEAEPDSSAEEENSTEDYYAVDITSMRPPIEEDYVYE